MRDCIQCTAPIEDLWGKARAVGFAGGRTRAVFFLSGRSSEDGSVACCVVSRLRAVDTAPAG